MNSQGSMPKGTAEINGKAGILPRSSHCTTLLLRSCSNAYWDDFFCEEDRPMQHSICDALMETLSSQLDLSRSRLQTLALLIIGMVNARTVNLSHLASQFPGEAQVASSYRRLQRFFQYVRLDGDW